MVLWRQWPALCRRVHYRPGQAKATLSLWSLDGVSMQCGPIFSRGAPWLQVGEDQPRCIKLAQAPSTTFGSGTWQLDLMGGELTKMWRKNKTNATLPQAAPRPTDSEIYYNFSSFTMKLNEAGQGGKLAPTDCRNRPDIRWCFKRVCIFIHLISMQGSGRGRPRHGCFQERVFGKQAERVQVSQTITHVVIIIVVCKGKSSRTKRKASGGHQDGLCLRNHRSLETMTGELLETFGRKTSQDLPKYFDPPVFRFCQENTLGI